VKGFGRRPIATVGQAPGLSSESPQGRNPRGVKVGKSAAEIDAPLHVSGPEAAAVAGGIFVLHLSVEQVGHGLEAAVRMIGIRRFGPGPPLPQLSGRAPCIVVERRRLCRSHVGTFHTSS
jgi:hypothetical protein